MGCLDDADDSIRLRALDLLSGILFDIALKAKTYVAV